MKIVLAYSGGLDTSVLVSWLKEHYNAEIITFAADVGQEEELDGLAEKAKATGASAHYTVDLVEEFAKGLGVYLVRDSIAEPEDGMVYGGASGLGFAATENLLYGLTAYLLLADFRSTIVLILVRSISSALLHASASGVMGYGVGRSLLISKASVIPYYLLAVFMHGVFNYLAAFEIIYQDPTAVLYGFFLAMIFAISAFALLRHGIRAKDYR